MHKQAIISALQLKRSHSHACPPVAHGGPDVISMSKHPSLCVDVQLLSMTLLQALAQVDSYLRKMPWAVKEAVDDTAGAAQTIAKGELR